METRGISRVELSDGNEENEASSLKVNRMLPNSGLILKRVYQSRRQGMWYV